MRTEVLRAGWAVRALMVAVTGLALASVEARADHVFTLSGVTFDDNTSITGTFTTNDALTSLLDFNLTTVNGAITGFNYTPGTVGSSSTALPSIIVLSTASLDRIIQLTFTGLSPAGAPITIGQFDSFEQDAAGTHRQVTAGRVIAANGTVPEPSSVVMAGAASIAGLGAWARRRRAA